MDYLYGEFGGTEVWNIARLIAYADAGAAPPGLELIDPTDSDPEVYLALGHQPYTTPAGDAAPWVDVEDPDSLDAAGIMPITITGWDDSTRTVVVEDAVRGGGIARSAVYGAKTIQVTALLIGSTTAGVQVLRRWLTDTLHRTCELTEEAPLVGYTSSPPVAHGAVNAELDPVASTYRMPSQFSVSGGAATLDATPVVIATNEWPNPQYLTTVSPWVAAFPSTTVTHGATATGLVLITPTAPLTSAFGTADALGFSLVPGREYTLSMQLTHSGSIFPDADLNPKFVTIYYGGTIIATVPMTAWDADPNRLVTVTATFTATAATSFTLEADLGPQDGEVRSIGIDWTILTAGPNAYFDGSTPDTAELVYDWVGTPNASKSTKSVTSNVRVTLGAPGVQIVGPATGPVCDTVTARWLVTPADGVTVQATPAFLSGGELVWVGATTTVAAPGQYALTATAERLDQDWQPVLLITGTVGAIVGVVLTVTHRPLLLPFECANEYRRTYPRVVTVDGPNETATESLDCGTELVTVEWTWVATTPWRYSDPRTLVAGLGQVLTPALVAPGVVTRQVADTAATPWRCDAPVPVVSCAPDPGNPGFVAPPAAPVIADTNRVTITTQTVAGVQVGIPAELIPEGDGAFTFTLTNDNNDKVGLRLRVYDNATGLFQPADVCDFAYEYHLDYLAPNAVLTIDGTTGEFRVLCAGNAETQDASGTVRGDYGGPVQLPSASCNGRYLVVLQWLATYPRTVVGYYTSGGDTGDLELTVDVHKRES